MIEVLTESIKIKTRADYTVSVIVLKKTAKKIYSSSVLGKPMSEWVLGATKGYMSKVVEYDAKLDSKEFIKPFLEPTDYTLVLYAHTPLITRGVVAGIVEYVTMRESKATKLPIGYMVKNDYLKTTKDIMFDSVYNFHLDAFYEVEDAKQLKYVTSVISSRINTFYMENGVTIDGSDTVVIEPSVCISSGVTIMSHNTLKGNTSIGEGTVIKEKNVLEDCTIGKGCLVSNSNISRSTLYDGVCVGSYCEILDSVLKEDVVVNKYSTIESRTIRKKTVVPERSTLVLASKEKKC